MTVSELIEILKQDVRPEGQVVIYDRDTDRIHHIHTVKRTRNGFEIVTE